MPTVLKASSPEHVILPARPEMIVCPGVPPTLKLKELVEVSALLSTRDSMDGPS